MGFDVARAYIVQAESQLGVRFPASFTSPMMMNNGDAVTFLNRTWVVHPFFDDSSRRRLSRSANHLVLETIGARSLEWFPQEAVCIASGDDGDRLVLLPLPNDPSTLAAAVHLWEFHGGRMCSVAQNFLELLVPA